MSASHCLRRMPRYFLRSHRWVITVSVSPRTRSFRVTEIKPLKSPAPIPTELKPPMPSPNPPTNQRYILPDDFDIYHVYHLP